MSDQSNEKSYLFRVLLIPASVFLSVIFGGSYGSGREVMEFISQHGPTGGLLSLAVTFLTYTVILFLCFEISRLFRAFDYRSFCDKLLGRAWFLYEIVIMVGMVITLAVVSTVAGTVMQDHFGVPIALGTVLVLALVITMNYLGRELIEKSMMLSVSALFAVLFVVLYFVFRSSDGALGQAFDEQVIDLTGWKGALKYAIVGTGFLPLLLYCARGLRTRKESLIAALAAGLVTVVPALAFHLAFMTQFPAITTQALPTYFLFEKSCPAWALNLYVIILFVLICQTGVGVLQGFIERIDVWREQKTGHPMTRLGHGLTAGFMMTVSLLLGSMGVVALILRGYTVLSVSFLVVFTIPLLTWGVVLVFRRKS
jgi:uncharacterized membrane protein YkvI